MGRADDCRTVSSRKIGSDVSRYDAWLFVPRAQRAAQRVYDTPFHFVHDFFRKILKPERGGIISKLMSKCCLHESCDFNLPTKIMAASDCRWLLYRLKMRTILSR